MLTAHSIDFIFEELCSDFAISLLPGGREICLHTSVLNSVKCSLYCCILFVMKVGKLPYVLVITKVTQLFVYTLIIDEENPQFSTENFIILFAILVWLYFLFLPFVDINNGTELLPHYNDEGLLLGKEFC